jgi:hypothetical protein
MHNDVDWKKIPVIGDCENANKTSSSINYGEFNMYFNYLLAPQEGHSCGE